MIASGHPLPTAAPIGTLPEPPDCRFAKTTRGAGAVAGNRRRAAMLTDQRLPVLKFDEAESVAADLARCWVGLTGITTVPSIETLTDLVQRVQRKSREIIAAREDADADGLMHIPENDLPY